MTDRANPFQGRPRRRIVIESVRAITRQDLPRILKPRDKSATIPQKLRESHHTIARLLATGLSQTRVAFLTGYTPTRVNQLATAPAMQDLIANYRAQATESFVETVDAFYDLATANMLAAERHLADRIGELDEVGELLSVREALAISRDAADRFGYGKKQTNLNVNADFAALLEKAIAKSGKIIDGVSSPAPRQALGAPTTQPREAPSAPLRRLH
jgi:hypothetical protein